MAPGLAPGLAQGPQCYPVGVRRATAGARSRRIVSASLAGTSEEQPAAPPKAVPAGIAGKYLASSYGAGRVSVDSLDIDRERGVRAA
jgi:hypothetical protein